MGNGLDGGLGSVGCAIGRDSCGQEIVLFTFQLHFLDFEGLWMGLGRSWGQIGFRLVTMAKKLCIGGQVWCFKARL